MRKNFFKKALAVMGVTTLLLGMSSNVYAASDDIVLEIGKDGVPITEIGTADGSGYKYQGVFSATGSTEGYKYLSITYTGDAGALDELRLEFATGGVRWFRENDEGVLVDKDGNQAPAPSKTPQTFIIDLEKSVNKDGAGVVAGGATHIHDTLGKGVLKISEAKLMKELPAAPETTTATQQTTAAAQQTTAAAQQTTAAAGSQAATGSGAGAAGAPTTGDSSVAIAMIATLVAGAAVVAVASRKKANAAE